MTSTFPAAPRRRPELRLAALLSLPALLATMNGCASAPAGSPGQDDQLIEMEMPAVAIASGAAVRVQGPQAPGLRVTPPTPDPRVGLKAGMFDADEAIWNMRMLSTTPPEEPFVGSTNSDLAFHGQLRHSGQLQRHPGVGHLGSGEPGVRDHLRLPRLAE